MKILRSQKNSFYTVIIDHQIFSTSQFSISDTGSSIVVSFLSSEYEFRLYEDSRSYQSFIANYIPGENVYQEATSGIDWDAVLSHFESWLNNLEHEVSAPDLWGNLQDKISNIAIRAVDQSLNQFTASEFEDLQSRMTQLSADVSNLTKLTKEQQSVIVSSLERIEVHAKMLGKRDWWNLLIGTILDCIFQTGINQDNALLLWEYLKSNFQEYIMLR